MKAAIVTGASRGIGAATARLLAKQGYYVAVNYHKSTKEAEKVVEEITKNGGKAFAVQADMGNEAEIIRMFDVVNKKCGGIAALVNNAAINPSGAVEKMEYSVVEELFRINTFGVFTACREAIKFMKKTGGAIVNVSSEVARFGGNQMSHYAASKAAVNAFSIGFAREVAPYNIRVNIVSPGIIDTEAHAGISAEKLATLPMGRMGKPEEVAEAIAWLLSDAASYVSGTTLSVSGTR